MKSKIIHDINHNKEIIDKVQNSKKQTAIAVEQCYQNKKILADNQK